MSSLIYLETNWIVGAVMGQDPFADELLDSHNDYSIAIPAVCIMEAISSLDWKRLDRTRLKGELDFQLTQLRRSRDLRSAQALVTELTQADLTNAKLLTELFVRLDDYLARLARQAVLIPLSARIVNRQLSLIGQTELKRDDALILATILMLRPTYRVERVFLLVTVKDFGVEPVKSLIRSADIKQFSSSKRALAWLQRPIGT